MVFMVDMTKKFGTKKSTVDKIISLLKDTPQGISTLAIAKSVDVSITTARTAIVELKAKNLIEQKKISRKIINCWIFAKTNTEALPDGQRSGVEWDKSEAS